MNREQHWDQTMHNYLFKMAATDNLNICTRSSIGHIFNIIIIIIFLIPITPETITWASFTAKAITNDIQNGRGGHVGLDFEVENDMNHCANMVYKLLDQNNKKKKSNWPELKIEPPTLYSKWPREPYTWLNIGQIIKITWFLNSWPQITS